MQSNKPAKGPTATFYEDEARTSPKEGEPGTEILI